MMKKIISFILSMVLLPALLLAETTSLTIDPNHLKDDGGNIAIGTSSAKSTLDVNGSASVKTSLSVGGVATVASTWDISDAIVADYEMEDTSGTTVTDDKGANNGTASGDLSTFTTTGRLGNGFSFASPRIITLTGNAAMKPTTNFSVSLWVKTTTASLAYFGSNRSNVAPNIGHSVYTSAGKAVFAIDTGSNLYAITSSTSINTGAWFNIITVYDGIQIIIYVNGVQDATPVAATGDAGTGAGTYLLGKEANHASTYYSGSMDQYRIYNRVLTQTEITQVYNGGSGTLSTSGSISASNTAKFSVKADGTTTGNALLVADSTGAPKFTILENGNVGVGSTTPINKLGVAGGTVIGANYAGIKTAPTNGLLVEGNVGVNSTAPGATVDVAGTVRATAFSGDGSGLTGVSGGASGGGWTDGGTVVFNTTSSDNVGVGTTTASQKLSVTGNIAATGTVTGSNLSGTNTGDQTNITGNAATVTTNANLTGDVTSVGNAATIASVNKPWQDGGTNIYMSTTTDKVGIGTTSPATTLEIVKQSTNAPLMISSTNSGAGDYIIVTSGGRLSVGTTTPQNHLAIRGAAAIGSYAGLNSAPTNGLIVSGNVGVGTHTPSTEVQVVGTVTATAFSGDGSAITGIVAGGFTDDGTNVRLTTGTDNVGIGTTTPSGKFGVWGNGTTTGVNTMWRDSAGTARMSILDNGNVGIGTTTPVNKFGVAGGVVIGSSYSGITTAPTDGLLVQGNLGVGTTVPPNKLYVAGTGEFTGFKLNGNGVAAGYVLTSGSTGIGTWMPAASGGGSGTINSGSASRVAIYSSAGTTIDSSSILTDNGTNFGIGSTSPQTALVVNGTATATAFVGDGSGLTAISSNGGGWTDGGPNVYTSATTDNVGIGTTTPTATLLVENAVSTVDSFRVNDSALDSSPFIINSAGNVGIGTTTASSFVQVTDGGASNVTFNLAKNGMTSGVAMQVSSSSTSSSVTGSLATFILSGASGQTGTSLFAQNAGPAGGYVFRANDVASDPSPFIIDNSGNVGIGTDMVGSTAHLAVLSGNVGFGTINPNAALTIGSGGHIHMQGTAPTVANNDCGTTSQGTITAKSTDVAGFVTAGTLAVTSCAVTFNAAWTNAPVCVATDDTNILAIKASATTTKLTLVSTTSMSGDVISWICIGNE